MRRGHEVVPTRALLWVGSAALSACAAPPPTRTELEVTRAWRSETFAGCLLASPQRVSIDETAAIVVASGDGRVALLDPETGTTRASLALPHPEGELAHVIATPALVPGPRLVVAWQDVLATVSDPARAPRSGHHVAIVDLRTMALDPAFPIVTLEGAVRSTDGTGDVPFLASNALSRSALVHAPSPTGLGRVYVSFGNARDIQPWHGWVFELDLDRWREQPISGLLLTTPTADCGPAGVSGDRDMVCGGGVWAPTGPLLVPGPSSDADDYTLIVPTGNGALDLDAQRYAHTLMRMRGPGLRFDPGCDPALCADFDVLAPSEACLASCRDLFVPRLRPGDPPLGAPGCEGLSFFACYAALDWDLGANSPIRLPLAGGDDVLVLPAKDGAVYLIDAEHLGTLHDRHEVNVPCGTGGVRCDADWAGSMVTRPVLTTDARGAPLVLVATFLPDASNDAGLVALRVTRGPEGPRLERAWESPRFGSDEAGRWFRRHPSGVALATVAGRDHAVVVEQGRAGVEPGHLHVVRVEDGALVARVALEGPGQRFAVPLVLAGPTPDASRVAFASCVDGNAGPGHLEAWDLAPTP
jgi:hypothetical protein